MRTFTLSLLLTFFLILLTAVTTLADDNAPTSRSTSTRELPSEEFVDKGLEDKTKELLESTPIQPGTKTILRLSWRLIPNAVKYRVSFDNEVYTTYTNGIEVQVDNVSKNFHVTALNLNNQVVQSDIDVTNIEINPPSPKTTSEFDKMDYAPLYPVYSWVPTYNADYYQVQLLKDGQVVRNYEAHRQGKDEAYDFYDEYPVNEGGDYNWRVRAMSYNGTTASDWSPINDSTSFKVTAPAKVCALGDSITHGGGAVTVPPSMTIYNWETYCEVPVKNLGKSGDTTDVIVERFESDVLPFAPKVLIIMAGVNDYRGTIFGWHTISNYKILIDKCAEYGIVPVFLTPTPINPRLIKDGKLIELPPYDWQEHYKFVCNWIKTQPNFIDLTSEFEDGNGDLKAELTSDGLHPDGDGKQIIGRAVSQWLNEHDQLWLGN